MSDNDNPVFWKREFQNGGQRSYRRWSLFFGFQSAVDFPELEGSVKRNLVTKRSDFEGYIHSASFFRKDRKNTLHAVDTKLFIHLPVRQIKIES